MAKIPQVKCGFCGIKSEKPLMIQDVNKKYYHKSSCYDEFLAEKDFKRKEFEKKVKLSETIAEVYELDNIQMIPHQIYPYLEDLRNDSKMFGRLGKSYKNGIKYEAIALTYLYCKDVIREVHRTKEFKNFLMELRYGLAVIKNNLVDCKNDFETKQRLKKSLEITKSFEFISIEVDEEVEIKYVKNDEDDISDLLD